jgi:hypothetical protein
MRYERLCAIAAALLMVPLAPSTLRSDAGIGCPPPRTWTTGPDDQTGLVLAGGADLVAERVAGPFDMPWSVALLPDGRFSSRSGRGICNMSGPELTLSPSREPRKFFTSAMADCSRATVIRKASPSTAPPASYGPMSTDHKAAMSSTWSAVAAIAAGPSPRSASIIRDTQLPSTVSSRVQLPVHYWVDLYCPLGTYHRDRAGEHQRACRRDGGAARPRRQLRAR